MDVHVPPALRPRSPSHSSVLFFSTPRQTLAYLEVAQAGEVELEGLEGLGSKGKRDGGWAEVDDRPNIAARCSPL